MMDDRWTASSGFHGAFPQTVECRPSGTGASFDLPGPKGNLDRDVAPCRSGSGRAVAALALALALVSVNTQMGLGHEHFDEDLKAWASDFRMSKSNHQQFYGRWAQLMKADWAQMSRGNGWAGDGHVRHQ